MSVKAVLLGSTWNNLFKKIIEENEYINQFKLVGVVADRNGELIQKGTESMIDNYTVAWHKGRETEEEYQNRVHDTLSGIEYDFVIVDWEHGAEFLRLDKPILELVLKDRTVRGNYLINGERQKESFGFTPMEDEVLDQRRIDNLFELTFNTLLCNVLYSDDSDLITCDPRFPLVHQGKVRDCYDVGYGVYAMVHSDRQSAFDRHICNIPGKGVVLTSSAANWFKLVKNNVRHLKTHYLGSIDNIMFVKKCKMIPIEMVIRGYITGSTSTSLWTHYEKGERVYCGITFPDGLQKNQKLNRPVITPTTKGETDELISGEEIIKRGIVTEEQWKKMCDLTYDLFKIGQMYADTKGLILVDTKYEFGLDENNNIVLCDEVHTCDSSRFWLKESYEASFAGGVEPEKLDKDVVRDWVRRNCDPYNEPIPEVPKTLIETAQNAYTTFYNMLFSDHCLLEIPKTLMTLEEAIDVYFLEIHPEKVSVYYTEDVDKGSIQKMCDYLDSLNLYNTTHCVSIYTDSVFLQSLLQDQVDRRVVNICIDPKWTELASFCINNSKYPTISIVNEMNEVKQLGTMFVTNEECAAYAVKRILDLKE